MVASERRCIGVDRRCRESEGKAKIEGYMSVSDEEAHQRYRTKFETAQKSGNRSLSSSRSSSMSSNAGMLH